MTQKVRFQRLEYYGFGPNVMKKRKVCDKCGKMVGADTRFCPECGELLPRDTLFDRYKQRHICCRDCDTVLAPGSHYCPNCGTRILPNAAGNENGGG